MRGSCNFMVLYRLYISQVKTFKYFHSPSILIENRSVVSPPMKCKAKKRLAETDKGLYYTQDDKNVLR